MRIGQKNGLVYQWAKKGTRPRQPKDQRYANAYLFGAICPARDMGAALVLPFANAGAMQHHLNEISRRVTVGAHAVLTLDKAGWHTTRKLHVPANISLLASAARQPGAEPDREHLAVSAPKLSLKSRVPRLRRCCRGVRLSLEQAHCRARSHRLHRYTRLDCHQSRSVKVGITGNEQGILPRNREFPFPATEMGLEVSRHCMGMARGGAVGRPLCSRRSPGPVAQWFEPAAHNGLVGGSNPPGPTLFHIAFFLRSEASTNETTNAWFLLGLRPIACAASDMNLDGGRRTLHRASRRSSREIQRQPCVR